MEHKPEHHKEKHVDDAKKNDSENDNKNTEENKEVDSGKSLKFVVIIAGIIIIILAGIFVWSTYFRNAGDVTYNNYVFQKFETNKWMTQQLIKGQMYNIPFYNNPNQVLDVPIDPNAISSIREFSKNTNGTVYISVDPEESSKIVVAAVEYGRILGTVYNIYDMNVKSAISTPVPGKTIDSPVITCDNASKDVMVIYQFVSDKNLVSIDNNCVLVESTDINESIRVADAFSFRLLNIIQE